MNTDEIIRRDIIMRIINNANNLGWMIDNSSIKNINKEITFYKKIKHLKSYENDTNILFDMLFDMKDKFK
jgi:hypothetical protein